MNDFPKPRRVRVSPEVSLSVHEAGEGPAVVLCHGFPELAYSWRHQLEPLARAGFRAIAPDQRGYGASDCPRRVEEYDLVHLTDDIVGLLDALGIERAVFVGHDWGGFVAWAMPVRFPERCLGVVGVNTPYLPFPSTDFLRAAFPEPRKLYILWFQERDEPERVLGENARAVFEKLLRRGAKPEFASLREAADANPFLRIRELEPRGEPLVSAAELDVFVKAFEHSGFFGPVSWYPNIDRNARLLPDVGTRKLELPCLQFTAEWDAALPPAMADAMAATCADLERVDIAACGHWTQQEKPDELNAALFDWLTRRFAR
jgi:pimeloyl-ACP methyl ester carboxylesterase